MSDSSSQSEEKPGTTNLTIIKNTINVHQADAVHGGIGDNIKSRKGITMS